MSSKVLIAVANAFTTLLTPTCYSLALAPMGDRAGTASGVIGFMTAAGGSALAALVDAAIDDTVTPMAVGYVLYGGIAVGMLTWAAVGRRSDAARVDVGGEDGPGADVPELVHDPLRLEPGDHDADGDPSFGVKG